jgi:uncharacterized membrane protein
MAAMGLGAALMYFLDPLMGRRRRAMMRDRWTHAWTAERDLLGKARRDLSNRAHGMVDRVRHPQRSDVSDDVIAERVRSRLGRLVSHPSSIDLDVLDGCVTLRGPVLDREVPRLLRGVYTVAGVCGVVDELEPHDSGARVPGLQGAGRIPRAWPMRTVWSPAGRAVTAAAGGGLIAWGLGRRGTLACTAATLAGSAMMLRSILNQPLDRLLGLGGRSAIEVQKTITVHAPIDQVFDLWSRFDNFPRFMQHVKKVDIAPDDPRRSHWEVDGPGGIAIGFDAEITRLVPDRTIAWRTRPNQLVTHAGTVHFEEADADATRVHVHLRYSPPAGAVGHGVAKIFGWDPKARIDDDLVRMKGLLEQGRTRAHGERVTAEDLH